MGMKSDILISIRKEGAPMPRPRASLAPADRSARSALLKLLAGAQPLARASLVSMARRCGKPGCHCAKGEKHVSLYLAARLNEKRQMIYIPPALEAEARGLVENGRRVEELIGRISQAALSRLVARKADQAARGRRGRR
jgi:hypothetical protein